MSICSLLKYWYFCHFSVLTHDKDTSLNLNFLCLGNPCKNFLSTSWLKDPAKKLWLLRHSLTYSKINDSQVKFLMIRKREILSQFFKKRRKEDQVNNRPASITSMHGKIMEKIFMEAMLRYLQGHDPWQPVHLH